MANKAIQILLKAFRDSVAVLKGHGIDHHDGTELTSLQKVVHFFVLTWKGFVKNRCPVRATALAYTTLLALIPLLAVAASVSTGLLQSKGQKPIEVIVEKIIQNVAPQLDLVPKEGSETGGREKVVQTITEAIEKVEVGKLGVTGMIALVFVAIMLLSTIEATFNDIWGVTVGRTWLTRVIQYWATVTLGPLIPILAMALNAGSQVSAVEDRLNKLGFLGEMVVRLTPFIVLSLAFALLYQLMPNTRVRWKAALVGGLVGGSLWQLNSLLNIVYASKVTSYANLYGPLSLVPVFLVGLYFSWMILLFGAQVAYTFQNRSVYLQERLSESISEEGLEFVALRVMTVIAQRFRDGAPPADLIQLSQNLNVPTRTTGDLLETMKQGGLLVEVGGPEVSFTVARPLDRITTEDILLAVRRGHGRRPETRDDPTRAVVAAAFDRIREAEHSVSANLTLAQLLSNEPSPARKGSRQDPAQTPSKS